MLMIGKLPEQNVEDFRMMLKIMGASEKIQEGEADLQG